MACASRYGMVVVLLVIFTSLGCSQRMVKPSSMQPTVPSDGLPSIEHMPPIYGEMAVVDLGAYLVDQNILTTYPASDELVYLDGPGSIPQLNAQLSRYGYGIRGTSLVLLQSHHPIEEPDSLGRALQGQPFFKREQAILKVEFWRYGGGVDIRNPTLEAGAQVARFAYRVTPGIEFDLSSTVERTVTEFTVLGDSSAEALESNTRAVEAGLEFTGFVGSRPEGVRLTGQLNVSSFIGTGIERASQQIPIEVDAMPAEWVVVALIDSADVQARLAFQAFTWSLNAGGEQILVRIRVDPLWWPEPEDLGAPNSDQQNPQKQGLFATAGEAFLLGGR